MTKRQQQALETKQKILEVAQEMVLEQGSFDVPLEDIAAQCGVVKGTIYHYFKSKNQLFLSISQALYRKMKGVFLATQGQAPYLERMKGFIFNWFTYIDRVTLPLNMDSGGFLADAGKNSEGQSAPMENGLEIIQECLRGAVDTGELRADTPVEALSLEIIFSLHGAALHKQKYDKGFDLMSWARMFADTILPGLLAGYLPAKR